MLLQNFSLVFFFWFSRVTAVNNSLNIAKDFKDFPLRPIIPNVNSMIDVFLQVIPHFPGRQICLYAAGGLPWRGTVDNPEGPVSIPSNVWTVWTGFLCLVRAIPKHRKITTSNDWKLKQKNRNKFNSLLYKKIFFLKRLVLSKDLQKKLIDQDDISEKFTTNCHKGYVLFRLFNF